MTERRAHKRFEVDLEAEIRFCNGESRLKGLLINIGKGGAFIMTEPDLELGERVEIRLDSGKSFVGDLARSWKHGGLQSGFAVKFLEKGVLVRPEERLTLQTSLD